MMDVSTRYKDISLSTVVISVAIGCSTLFAGAQDLTVACGEQPQSDAALEVRLTYHGEDSGELIVSGPLGDMVLPATKEVVDKGGQNRTIGIRAFGNADALMPDKAKLEQCIAKRLGETAEADDNDKYLSVLACSEQVPPASSPIAITSTVYLSVDEPPTANVTIVRTFVEASDVVGERIALESFPKGCSVR